MAHLFKKYFFLFWGKLSSIFSIKTTFPLKTIVVGIQQKQSVRKYIHHSLLISITNSKYCWNTKKAKMSLNISEAFGLAQKTMEQAPLLPEKMCHTSKLWHIYLHFSPLPFRRGAGGEVLSVLGVRFLRINLISQQHPRTCPFIIPSSNSHVICSNLVSMIKLCRISKI